MKEKEMNETQNNESVSLQEKEKGDEYTAIVENRFRYLSNTDSESKEVKEKCNMGF